MLKQINVFILCRVENSHCCLDFEAFGEWGVWCFVYLNQENLSLA